MTVVLACIDAATASRTPSVSSGVAREESDRHARRLQDLKRQQEKLLQLYYRDGISVERMQQEQARINHEEAEVEWQQTALVQIDDVMQALDEALQLIDGTSVGYAELSDQERRLLNLAIFDDFLLEEDTDGLTIQPQREETYVVLCQFADEVMAWPDGASRPLRAASRARRA